MRDEFEFRCIYCLKRERWGTLTGSFDLDHFLPQDDYPDLKVTYENLLYTCHGCNLAKSKHLVASPCEVAYGLCLEVQDDGTIKALNAEGKRLIDVIGLDDPNYIEFRLLILQTLSVLAQHKPNLTCLTLGYSIPPNSPIYGVCDLRPTRVPQACKTAFSLNASAANSRTTTEIATFKAHAFFLSKSAVAPHSRGKANFLFSNPREEVGVPAGQLRRSGGTFRDD